MTTAVKLLDALGRPATMTVRERPSASVADAPGSTYGLNMATLVLGFPPKVIVGGKVSVLAICAVESCSYSIDGTRTIGALGGGGKTVV